MQPPPGYPFPGPLRSRPADSGERGARDGRSASGLAGFAIAFAGLMTGAGFLLAALMVGQLRHRAGMLVPGGIPMPAPAAVDDEGSDPSRRVVDSPPPPPRNVPTHPVRFLEGCSASELTHLEEALIASIGRGAPLYNDGDLAGCADEYERTAAALEGALLTSCSGPARALGDGRSAASRLGEPGARAWAMRDAFDGLVEVIDRSRSGGVDNL